MMIVDSAALAGGFLQAPLSDIGSDWIWWYAAPLVQNEDASLTGTYGMIQKIDVDSKAMRKVGLNQALVLVAEVSNCEGALTANVHGSIRVLLKAP